MLLLDRKIHPCTSSNIIELASGYSEVVHVMKSLGTKSSVSGAACANDV
jgi:hypothetical protein